MSDLVGNPEDQFSRVAAHIQAICPFSCVSVSGQCLALPIF